MTEKRPKNEKVFINASIIFIEMKYWTGEEEVV